MIKGKETEPENWRYLRPEGAKENTIKERGTERGSREPKTGPLNCTAGKWRLCT